MASFENPIPIIEKYCVEETSENNCCKKVWKKQEKNTWKCPIKNNAGHCLKNTYLRDTLQHYFLRSNFQKHLSNFFMEDLYFGELVLSYYSYRFFLTRSLPLS